jgi:hypothetical protein
MLRIRTIKQWVLIFQIAVLIIFFILAFTGHSGVWAFIFLIPMVAAQAFLWFYEWKKGNLQPLKDAGFRYLVLIATLLLLLLIFGKGI